MPQPDWSRTSTSAGYIVVYCPDHPRAWSTGYILAHRAVMEQHLGRLLEPWEVVHHRNENKHDNRIENLEIVSARQHLMIHHATGRSMVALVCPNCSTEFVRELRQTHLVKGGKHTFCSRRCNGLYGRREPKVSLKLAA